MAWKAAVFATVCLLVAVVIGGVGTGLVLGVGSLLQWLGLSPVAAGIVGVVGGIWLLLFGMSYAGSR